MIAVIIFTVLGLLAGSFINWAADVAPRFAVDKSRVPRRLQPRWRLAIGALPAARRLTLPAAVELLCAALFAYIAARYGGTWTAAGRAALTTFFVLIAVIDLKYQLVLNVLLYPAGVLVILLQLSGTPAGWISAVVGGAFGLIIFMAVAWLRPGELGGGDVKLAALIGLLFGFPDALWALLVAVGAGGVAAIVLMKLRHQSAQARMPYAPFLCLGAVVALFYNPLMALFQL